MSFKEHISLSFYMHAVWYGERLNFVFIIIAGTRPRDFHLGIKE